MIVGHLRRKLIRVSVTTNPTAEWIAGQVTEAFPGTKFFVGVSIILHTIWYRSVTDAQNIEVPGREGLYTNRTLTNDLGS